MKVICFIPYYVAISTVLHLAYAVTKLLVFFEVLVQYFGRDVATGDDYGNFLASQFRALSASQLKH